MEANEKTQIDLGKNSVNEMKENRIFDCLVCEEKFAKFNDLRRHKKTHINKPFKCPKCDRNFDQFGALSEHNQECDERSKRTHIISSWNKIF